MGRMIDADKLKEFIDDCGICDICPQKAPRCSYDCDFPEFVTEKWNVAIDAQPTVEAVSVVRCYECKHRTYCYGDVVMTNKSQTANIYKSVNFCSYGERETDHE